MLTRLAAFGLLAAAALWVWRTSRGFSASPLADAPVRRVTRTLPPLGLAMLLCFLALGLLADAPGARAERLLSGGAAPLLMLGLVLLPLGAAVAVAAQGFALGERSKRRGDADTAGRLAARAFLVVLVGGGTALLSLFAALVLAGDG